MKRRQIEILNILINNQVVDMAKLLDLYQISKRSLFYDLAEINYQISLYGSIKTNKKNICLELQGNHCNEELKKSILLPYYQSDDRKKMILLSLLEENTVTIDDFAREFDVSRSTIVNDIDDIKNELGTLKVKMVYKNKKYTFSGSEINIRNKYLELLEVKTFDFSLVNSELLNVNALKKLNLSDYSLFYLSNLLQFISKRLANGNFIEQYISQLDNDFISKMHLFFIDERIKNNRFERNYINSYLASILSFEDAEASLKTKEFVDKLILYLNSFLSINVNDEYKLYQDLLTHLKLSYHRIKYNFPVYNQQVQLIIIKYFYLFSNTKRIVKSIGLQPFSKMSDEEIAYIVIYIGGYIYNEDLNFKELGIAFVCPEGRAISHHLMMQFNNYFPGINVVGTYSIREAEKISKNLDYLISTVDLPNCKNTIKVNPILTKQDVMNISKMLDDTKRKESDTNSILTIIKEYADVFDEKVLYQKIYELLSEKGIKKGYEPMLYELITKDKIQRIEKVNNFEEAIRLAAKPLLDEGVIEEIYIENMIANVYKFGPYIVLVDGFALAHASGFEGVNRIGMSLLVSDKSVDFLGKPVNIVVVMASTDSKSHLKALTTLTKIISDEEKLKSLQELDVEGICELIREVEK